ncbi:hypothetical protein [Schleiferilactobacillus shenzhenensis]|uniref:hypothetical protein n=1 Tax=Schleiferilactobacillus shenzhenensis TaxID=1231337 RepID=UPI00058B0C1E|nr:hypothetical protein [Schleiferilactobacillus shenzhenensis]
MSDKQPVTNHHTTKLWPAQVMVGIALLPFTLIIIWLASLALTHRAAATLSALVILSFGLLTSLGAPFLIKHGFRW